MKVLMFGWEFPPHISGGLGTACYGLSKSLKKEDVDILFVMPKSSGSEDSKVAEIIDASEIPLSEIIINENITNWNHIKFIKINSALIPYLSPEYYKKIINTEENNWNFGYSHTEKKYNFSGNYGSNLMEEVFVYSKIASEIAKNYDFDIIHAHDWLTYLAGINVKRITKKPLIVHVHATEFDRSGENINYAVYELEKLGMENADKVITVSDWTKQIVVERYGIDKSKIITVHNGVEFNNKKKESKEDKNTYYPKKVIKEKIVTFLGRITFQKGPEYFIEAAYKIIKVYPKVRFVMAGNGDLIVKIIKRVAQLRIGSHFTFTGFLVGDEVQRMYSQSDVYVMPSVSEPFGISPLEAMKMGIPVIISKQSGVSEVVRSALKIDFWDIDSLANSIYGILAYPKLSEMLIKEGFKEVNEISWSNAAVKVKNIYESLIHKNSSIDNPAINDSFSNKNDEPYKN